MNKSHDIIKVLMRTEKSTLQEPARKYLFLVDVVANKIEIKRAVEEIYKVKVADVNSLVLRGKMKRVRYKVGKTADVKRAVVTLKEGQKIDSTV